MPTEDPEIPACAAIQREDGVIIAGRRHDVCIKSAVACGWSRADVALSNQGFMTTRGRFVDREEGMRLFKSAGMRSAMNPDDEVRGSILTSEDLY